MPLTYTKRATKSLRRLPANEAARVRAAIEALAADPQAPTHDVKMLSGAAGLLRLRVGRWRVLFELPSRGEIVILDVRPRGSAYRGLGGDD